MKFISLVSFCLLIISLQACRTVSPPETVALPQKTHAIEKSTAAKILKRKVAIARFTNETKYGQGFFYDKNEDRLGKQAMDIFSAKLTASEKLLVFERADLAYLTKEKELGQLTDLNIPTDYLILGSVTEFGRKATSDVGVFSRSKKQTAYAKVSIRLVDVKTSRIIYSEEGAGEAFSEAGTVMGVGNTADYDATLNDKVISAAITKLVENIVNNLSEKPWRSYILSIQDGQYIIGGGAMQGIAIGDTFAVCKEGEKVKNPQTGMMIELPGKKVGTLIARTLIPGDVTSEITLCDKISGELPIEKFEGYYIQSNQ